MSEHNPTLGIKELNNYRVVLATKDGHPTWPSQDSWELTLCDIGYSDRVYLMTCPELQAELDSLRSKIAEHEKHIQILQAGIQGRDRIITALETSLEWTRDID